ncbi:hypothetical protein MKW94_025492 [Papaver nudicaule]|uniref:Uncharacterized protein n=1 Tax=Papaver nudicaule TaxID=74823 RepID=A0AA41RZ76_PAPNU|nr:hypothetical protein [Papaver nudicaule]
MDVLLLYVPHNPSSITIAQSLHSHSHFAPHLSLFSRPRTSQSGVHLSFLGSRLKQPSARLVRCHSNSGPPSPESDGEDIVPVLAKYRNRLYIEL